MFRPFLNRIFLQKPIQIGSTLSTRHYDTCIYYKNNPSTQTKQDAQDAGIRTDHPVILDAANPNSDGTLPIKGQLTHSNGNSKNPSKELDPQQDLSGQALPQKVVIPTKSLNVDPSKLKKKPIKGSDTFMDQKHVKDNLHKAGAKPSNYKSGDLYEP